MITDANTSRAYPQHLILRRGSPPSTPPSLTIAAPYAPYLQSTYTQSPPKVKPETSTLETLKLDQETGKQCFHVHSNNDTVLTLVQPFDIEPSRHMYRGWASCWLDPDSRRHYDGFGDGEQRNSGQCTSPVGRQWNVSSRHYDGKSIVFIIWHASIPSQLYLHSAPSSQSLTEYPVRTSKISRYQYIPRADIRNQKTPKRRSKILRQALDMSSCTCCPSHPRPNPSRKWTLAKALACFTLVTILPWFLTWWLASFLAAENAFETPFHLDISPGCPVEDPFLAMPTANIFEDVYGNWTLLQEDLREFDRLTSSTSEYIEYSVPSCLALDDYLTMMGGAIYRAVRNLDPQSLDKYECFLWRAKDSSCAKETMWESSSPLLEEPVLPVLFTMNHLEMVTDITATELRPQVSRRKQDMRLILGDLGRYIADIEKTLDADRTWWQRISAARTQAHLDAVKALRSECWQFIAHRQKQMEVHTAHLMVSVDKLQRRLSYDPEKAEFIRMMCQESQE